MQSTAHPCRRGGLLAESLEDVQSNELMLGIAGDYERMAELAEQECSRVAFRQRPGPVRKIDLTVETGFGAGIVTLTNNGREMSRTQSRSCRSGDFAPGLMAVARNARCVLAEIRWRWTLKVL